MNLLTKTLGLEEYQRARVYDKVWKKSTKRRDTELVETKTKNGLRKNR